MLTSELFVSMTAAAMHTQKIRLASGVMIPSNRIAPVAASGLATLNEIEDDKRNLERGLKIHRVAHKACSRLELNRIGVDTVLNLLPILEQAAGETVLRLDPGVLEQAVSGIEALR